ncbi:MAG TPA: GDSL-type esterase/lipase family protein [Vicinamibacterales bacterium]|nr:GDSL-type esterase/lipase family protein [Vicinamibacterales bacterium]
MFGNRGVVRIGVLALLLAAEFALLEAGMRAVGGSEAAPSFQQIFMQDPRMGHRLKPGARTLYSTVEFSTQLSINAQGVRDDRDLGPKRPGQTRVVVLGDSLVTSVQVGVAETFMARLEHELSAGDPSREYQVINAGVQGYGPVREWLFYRHIVDALEPDIVLIVAFVGNDATDAYDHAGWIDNGPPASETKVASVNWARRLARSSMVIQTARLRWDQLRPDAAGPGTERPLAAYLATPPVDVTRGLEISREAYGRIAAMAAGRGAQTAIVLMPARFQVDDGDYGRLRERVQAAGHELIRQAATERFRTALTPLGLPMLDLLPVLQAQPDPAGLFFQRNIHLTPRGHEVVGHALAGFVMGLPPRAR